MGGVFYPEDLRRMGDAFDAAMHMLGNPGVVVPPPIREAIAQRIIALHEAGLRDPGQLAKRALDVDLVTGDILM
jgi:hypothetical protein